MEKLNELFLKSFAKDNELTLYKAMVALDKCFKFTSYTLNVPLNIVFEKLLSPDGIKFYSETLSKRSPNCNIIQQCKQLSIKECESTSCLQCIIFEDKCVPRYFEDAQTINDDPDRYIKGLNEQKLEYMVKLASYLYHNYDGGGLTDNSFDALEYFLRKKKMSKHRLYEKIGAPPIEKIRATLPYFMPSLEKVKPGERQCETFLLRAIEQNISVDVSMKLDGVSGMLIYKKGILKNIYTRGDGTIGGDVSYLKDYLSFPKLDNIKDDVFVVRGEFVLSKKLFEEKYSKLFSNPRSFVSSKINSAHITPGTQDIDFIAYEIIDSTQKRNGNQSKSLKLLDALEFNTVKTYLLPPEELNVFNLATIYKENRLTFDYNIDGLVLEYDAKFKDIGNSNSQTDFLTKVAFKMKLEEQLRRTKVLNVEWNISRYGKLIPVVVFEAVYIDGVRIHRATGHNAAHIRDWNLGKGSIITIVRSGDVIPQILDVDPNNNININPLYPTKYITELNTTEVYTYHWEGQNLILDDIENNKYVQMKRIEYFFNTLGVKGIGEGTIKNMWEGGLTTVQKIVNSSPKELIKIKRIGKKTSQSHHENIKDALSNSRLDRFIIASSLSVGIGKKLIKAVIQRYPTLLYDDEEKIKKTLSLPKNKVPGIAKKRIESISQSIPSIKKFLFSLGKSEIEKSLQKEKTRIEYYSVNGGKNKNPLINECSFIFSGFRGNKNYDLEDYIYDNGGTIASSVSSKISCVIIYSVYDITSKIEMAQKLNIPIYTMKEFILKYKIILKSSKIENDQDDPNVIYID
jgi:DNA ligase (NAD+)